MFDKWTGWPIQEISINLVLDMYIENISGLSTSNIYSCSRLPNSQASLKSKSLEAKSFETMESLIKSLGLDLPIVPSDMLPQLRDTVVARTALDYDDILIKGDDDARPNVDLLAAICDGEDTVEKIIAALGRFLA